MGCGPQSRIDPKLNDEQSRESRAAALLLSFCGVFAACFAIVPRTGSLPVKVKPSGRCATLPDLPAGVLVNQQARQTGEGGNQT